MNLGSQLNRLLTPPPPPPPVSLNETGLDDMATYNTPPPGASGYTQEYGHSAEQLGDWGINAQDAQDTTNTFLSLTTNRGKDLNHWSKRNSGESNTVTRDPLDEEAKKNFVKQHGPPITTLPVLNGHDVTFADGTVISFTLQEEWARRDG